MGLFPELEKTQSKKSGGLFPELESQPTAKVSTEQPGLMRRAAELVGGGAPGQLLDPSRVLGSAPEGLSYVAGLVGEAGAEELGRRGVNPYVSAGLGTIAAMAPDIAFAGTNPAEGLAGIVRSSKATKAAVPIAENALGFSKVMRKSESARSMNKMAAEVALEQGVIPSTGSPIKMMQNAQAVGDKAAADMNDVFARAYTYVKSRGAPNALAVPGGTAKAPEVLEQQGRIIKPSTMISALEKLRPKQAAKGAYAADHAAIDMAIDTIKANGDALLTLQEANAIKTKIQSTIPYNTPGHEMAKRAAASVRESVDSSLDSIVEELGDKTLKKDFLDAKRRYGASQRMQEGIGDLLAKGGNNFLNLTALITGAGGYVAGGGGPEGAAKALALAAAVKGGQRAGMPAAANVINALGQSRTMLSPIMNTISLGFGQNRKKKQ